MDATADRALAAIHLAWLDRSLLRGLAHELANVTQMLALDPAPPGAVAAARLRLERVMAVMSALGRAPGSGSGPSVIGDALEELEAWQALQTGLPAASLQVITPAALPALAASHADVRTALLTLVSAARVAGGGELTLTLTVAAAPDRVRCTLAHRGGGTPSEEARALLRECGVSDPPRDAEPWTIEFAVAPGLTGSA